MPTGLAVIEACPASDAVLLHRTGGGEARRSEVGGTPLGAGAAAAGPADSDSGPASCGFVGRARARSRRVMRTAGALADALRWGLIDPGTRSRRRPAGGCPSASGRRRGARAAWLGAPGGARRAADRRPWARRGR